MKKILFITLLFCFLGYINNYAQGYMTIEGKCGSDCVWSFDGHTLSIERSDALKSKQTTLKARKINSYTYSIESNDNQKSLVCIPDYDVKTNPAPWVKRNLPIKKVKLGTGVERIGSCSFANCNQLETIEFDDNTLLEIGWGAFLNCTNLFNFSMPFSVRKIERVAFANCMSLRSMKIPAQARVEDYAFMSCGNLSVIDVANNVVLGKEAFVTEIKEQNNVKYKYYNGEIRNLPLNVTVDNCQKYGLSRVAVEKYYEKHSPKQVREEATSPVDTLIPMGETTRYSTYALIIGNENYRFVPNVPFAKHDALIFSEYCEKTLGIPSSNIHLCYDATKHMILEQEIEDWMKQILDKNEKNLIVYYAGHGVPDIRTRKSYILPTDVYGTKPHQGIALDDFYQMLGNMGFSQVTLFMDACFSGINRNNEAVNEGLRGTEIVVEDNEPTTGNLVVFSAAQGNETAQGYLKQGHGLFTYFLLKELQESAGEISYGELARKVQESVVVNAQTLELRKPQTPTVKASGTLKNTWVDIKL